MNANANEAPPYAQLKAGVTGKDVYDAITRSGYPFQAVVADSLRESISHYTEGAAVQEEWAYIDSETGQARAVDILAEVPLGDREGAHPLREPHPRLSLIVECKQSDFPYVFFLRNDPPSNIVDFLQIPGAASQRVRIFPDDKVDEGFSYFMTLHDIFGAYELPFFSAPAPWALSLSKVTRKPKLELTGEEAYRSLTLPLLKASEHLRYVTEKTNRHENTLRIILCLAVVRAPMIGVHLQSGEPNLISFPWVRVTHLEPAQGTPEEMGAHGSVRYYDVVHEDHLDDYVRILMESLNELANRIKGHHHEIFSGSAMCGSGENTWETLKPIPPELHHILDTETWAVISRQIDSLQITLRDEAGPPQPGSIAWVKPAYSSVEEWGAHDEPAGSAERHQG